MPFKDPVKKREMQTIYHRRWASKPEVRAYRNAYKRELYAKDPELAERRDERRRERESRPDVRARKRGAEARRRRDPATKARLAEQIAAAQKRNQEATAAAATRRGLAWTPEEDAVVLRPELTALEAALLVGRTHAAVETRRQRLRQERVR